MTNKKTAVIFDKQDSRAALATEALQANGYEVTRFNEGQARMLFEHIKNNKPDLVVTASMHKKMPSAKDVIFNAIQEGSAAVYYSMGNSDQRFQNELTEWKADHGEPVALYLYDENEKFDTGKFGNAVDEAINIRENLPEQAEGWKK